MLYFIAWRIFSFLLSRFFYMSFCAFFVNKNFICFYTELKKFTGFFFRTMLVLLLMSPFEVKRFYYLALSLAGILILKMYIAGIPAFFSYFMLFILCERNDMIGNKKKTRENLSHVKYFLFN